VVPGSAPLVARDADVRVALDALKHRVRRQEANARLVTDQLVP
jgi:hypothetical protein